MRLAYAGYLGHMWELYAFWAWIGAAAAASFAPRLGEDALPAARLLAFAAIALGGLLCQPAGRLADRIGKARVAELAMQASGAAGLATALAFGGPVWLVAALVLVWGAAVIPNSAQFSALVADAAPGAHAGSLLALQTALGFTLTFFTVQAVPLVADALGWRHPRAPGARAGRRHRGDAAADAPGWAPRRSDAILGQVASDDVSRELRRRFAAVNMTLRVQPWLGSGPPS